MNFNMSLRKPANRWSNWVCENRLFFKKDSSHFQRLFESPSPSCVISVGYHSVKGKPISLLVFEHYTPQDSFNKECSVSIKGVSYTYGCIGYCGVYVAPEFRKQGLANMLMKGMSNEFQNFTLGFNRDFIFVAGSDKAYPILRDNNRFYTTKSSANNKHWKYQVVQAMSC